MAWPSLNDAWSWFFWPRDPRSPELHMQPSVPAPGKSSCTRKMQVHQENWTNLLQITLLENLQLTSYEMILSGPEYAISGVSFQNCEVTILIRVLNWRVRHGKENICRGFHLLFPFSSSPISKAIMSEDERGKHWGIYIIYSSYIYIKMDLVQATIRNLLKQSPTSKRDNVATSKKTNLKMRSESLRTTTSLPGKTEWAFPQLWTTQCAEFQISPNWF